MELNKIFAAVLVAGIIAMVTGFVAEQLVAPVELEEDAYPVAAAEGDAPTEEAPAEEALPDIGTLLANADPAAGEAQTRACQACHSFEQGGANKVGPNLWGVVGAPVASHEGFNYSGAMTEHGGEWTYEELNGFLHAPRDWIPGTAMSYAGLKNDEDRADLIAYLSTLSDNPVPFPEPQAAEAPAEGDGAAAAPAEGGGAAGEGQTGGEPSDSEPGEAAGESDAATAGGQAAPQGGNVPTEQGGAEQAPAPAPAAGN
ncbi:MAG TPA: cytochrome c family protein [Alphaproteobacteria bacterium]|nr:cytochrome c family protein [Alphaproteobacteria bacterium]